MATKKTGSTSGQTVTIEQFRSVAGRTKEIKASIDALGLGKIGKKRTLPLNDAVKGMLRTVEHLVRVVK